MLLLLCDSHYARRGNGGTQDPNEWKYGILRAAEEVVRAGVLSYAPGSESEHVSPVSQFIDWSDLLVGFGWWGFVVWVVCFCGVLPWFSDKSVRSSYQPMTSLAYLLDCHSCYNERSNVQKKNPFLCSALLLTFPVLCFAPFLSCALLCSFPFLCSALLLSFPLLCFAPFLSSALLCSFPFLCCLYWNNEKSSNSSEICTST